MSISSPRFDRSNTFAGSSDDPNVPGRVTPRWPQKDGVDLDALVQPNSITWHVNGEIVMVIGWGRAILLQLAHPLVAAAVADHSYFKSSHGSRLERFRRTLEAMLDLTFGTREQATRTARRIDAIHGRVTGQLRESVGLFPANTVYYARDPNLLRWVHATLVDTALITYKLFIGPLTPAQEDQYCQEATTLGPLLGIPDGFLPTSREELRTYLRDTIASGQIAVGETARALARSLLAPPRAPLGRPLAALLSLPIVGLLPEPIRSDYGLPWDARRDSMLVVAASVSRLLLPRLPTALRRWPVSHARRGFGH